MEDPPASEEHSEIGNKGHLLKHENKGLWNNDDTRQKVTKKTEEKTHRFTANVESQSVPRGDHNKARRNSLMEIYHNNTIRRKSVKLLGVDVVTDESLDWRVKWGQRGIGIFSFLDLICYILAGGTNVGFRIATIIFAAITIICFCILYYKNVSLVIIKRLLTEPNVVIIIILTILNWAIEIGRPATLLSPINHI